MPDNTIEQRIEFIKQNSTYVANALKHVLLSQMLRTLWEKHLSCKLDIFSSEVDDAGYDFVLSTNNLTRYVQLKSSHIKAKAQDVEVNVALSQRPGGCVIWLFYDPTNLEIKHYLFWDALSELPKYKIAKRATFDSKGNRPDRPKIRKIPKSKFVKESNVEQMLHRLFGLDL